MFVMVMGIHLTSNLSNGRELVAPFLFNFSTMTMEKYYTPTIEEFHVGFEFEDKHSDYPEDEKNWIGRLYALRAEYELDTIQDRIGENKIRVKHLDREDIESLGFEVDKPYGSVIGFKFSDEEGVFLSSKKVSIWYEFKSKRATIARIKDWENGKFSKRSLFSGTIKNKSELKKLLKQLGI